MSHFLPTAEAVAALRAAADLIETLPDDHWYVEAETYNVSADELASAARLPGTWEKDEAGVDGTIFVLRQGIVELRGNRSEVCVARETGNTVKTQVVVTPAVYEEVEVPEIEWDCAPLLANRVVRS